MKMFLTYLLLIAPTAKAVAGASAGSSSSFGSSHGAIPVSAGSGTWARSFSRFRFSVPARKPLLSFWRL